MKHFSHDPKGNLSPVVFVIRFRLGIGRIRESYNFPSTRRLKDVLGIMKSKVKFGGFREFP
jgi:hypothetical protein